MKILSTLIILLTCHVCRSSIPADTNIIKSHLKILTKTAGFRTYDNIEQLNKTAEYITSVFRSYSDSIEIQHFTARGGDYQNIICSFGTENSKRIIIGAHYDVCGEQQGADDNASGVAGLLELARLLKSQKLNYRIDLVAYSLEEPPFFRTESMGSFVHARSLAGDGADVFGMISLEMIGYFSDQQKSQSYPIRLLSLFYGNRGNYITLVRKFGAGKFARAFCRKYKAAASVRTKIFRAPGFMPGIDFSDHLNYWKFDYSALMITDTAFYRNGNYHEPTDTMETLDTSRMAKVIDGVASVVLDL